jgi:hypothetical protein
MSQSLIGRTYYTEGTTCVYIASIVYFTVLSTEELYHNRTYRLASIDKTRV